MARKRRQEPRALARLERRPAAGSQSVVIASDPVTVGPDRTITVDVARLPTPQNVYDADFAWVEHIAGRVSFFFAKRNRDEPEKLRSRLEVRYPPENVAGHFWQNSRDFHARLRKFVDQWPADGAREALDPAKMPSARDHSEWANFDAIAHVGTEASIDFYSMPPSGIARFARGQGSGGLNFASVVRVNLTSFELVRWLDSAATIVDQINSYLPKLDHTIAREGK